MVVSKDGFRYATGTQGGRGRINVKWGPAPKAVFQEVETGCSVAKKWAPLHLEEPLSRRSIWFTNLPTVCRAM